MENNNNGKGIFYGVIGVATLVVAIIGATFAYFSATANDTTTIQGTAADTGLSLDVQLVSTDANGGLIPMNDTDVSLGLAGDTATGNKMCVDKNSNTVCQVYSIKVSNTGSASAVVKGDLELKASTTVADSVFTDLKWQLLTGTEPTALTTTTTYNPMATTSMVTGQTLASKGSAGDSITYYVMIWISNEDNEQNADNTGGFVGTVTFNSADGSGVSASFTATQSGGDEEPTT